jgi:hypothetical protein
MTIRLDSPGASEAFDIAMPTPPSPSLMAADSGTIEPPRLDQTLTPGVYGIINDEISNIVVDLSGCDKRSIVGKIRSRTHKQHTGGETDLAVRSAYDAHEGENQKA